MSDITLQEIMNNVYGAAAIGLGLVTPMLRPWRTRWGATAEEATRPLPGDHYVPTPKWHYTHAITINAPVLTVWEWLIQIGQERAGLYSYELLENLAGCQMHNAEQIVAKWRLQVGDGVKLHPKMPPLPVTAVEPRKWLILNAADDKTSVQVSWVFYLEAISENQTRLISRWRADYTPTRANQLGYGPVLMEPIGCVMDMEMLRGIKHRAERHIIYHQ